MPLKTGAVLRHRYRIENVLGQGGMGAVYKAIDVNLGVTVAVKENLFTTEEYSRQFRREATILASLRHPNLPRVTDHFVIDGEGQYLVMDFIQGDDLRQKLEHGGPIAEESALPWFLEICDALAYLHSRIPSILHRDIKPGNIKITPEERAILVDFGLAKVVDEDGATTTGAKAMTPGFSPPEQYGTGRTDPRTDVYALGATLYAALSATIPEDSLERAMGRAELTPLRKRNAKVSAAIGRAVERALAVRPEDRYQSVGEFAAALGAVPSASQPTVARSYPFLEKTQLSPAKTVVRSRGEAALAPVSPRRPWPLIAVGVITVALVLAGAAYAVPDLGRAVTGWFSGTGTHTGPVASSPTAGRLPASATPNLVVLPASPTSGEITTPIASVGPTATNLPSVVLPGGPTPTGGGIGQIAFASTRTGIAQVYLINVDGTGQRQLTNLPDGACQPAWSPDGKQLLVTSPCRGKQDAYDGAGLWLVNIDGSGQEQLPTAPGGDYDPAWSPDGKRVAFTSLRTKSHVPHLFVMNLDGSDLKELSQQSLDRDGQPAWAPTGTQLAFVANRDGTTEIRLVPDYGGASQPYSRPGDSDALHPDWSHDGRMVLFERVIGSIPRIAALPLENRGGADYLICPQGPQAGQPMAKPRWSPDDRWIAFETWPSGDNHEIALMTSSCTNYTLLTSDPGFDFDPAWRP